MIHSALLVAFYRCPLEEARAPREGQYKPDIAAFMMFTLTSAHFLTKQGLLLLSFVLWGGIILISFDKQV